MPYRWRKKVDVDEAVVVIKNSLDAGPDLPNWLIVTILGSIADSEPDMGRYFFRELKKHAPSALKYFESRE
ncbi:MAG: hypothetical protein LUQ31_00120 [Methanoregula sp.]|nr:hypothetical protein [Methanoregula sp.]